MSTQRVWLIKLLLDSRKVMAFIYKHFIFPLFFQVLHGLHFPLYIIPFIMLILQYWWWEKRDKEKTFYLFAFLLNNRKLCSTSIVSNPLTTSWQSHCDWLSINKHRCFTCTQICWIVRLPLYLITWVRLHLDWYMMTDT